MHVLGRQAVGRPDNTLYSRVHLDYLVLGIQRLRAMSLWYHGRCICDVGRIRVCTEHGAARIGSLHGRGNKKTYRRRKRVQIARLAGQLSR